LPTTGDLAFAVAINPLDDTDNDDLSDRWELSFPGVLDLTYLDGKLPAGSGPGSATGDFDGDGLSDFDEWNGGVNSTNPTRTDTDDDGYSDLAEDGVGSWLDLNFTGTSPLNPDTDGDGLMDGEENPNSGTLGGPVHECDPNKFDSDGDLYGDGDEVAAGNDPVVNTSVPTDIPFRNVNFSGIGGGWETVKGTTLDSTTELLAGSGQYALIEGATSGNGLRIEHVNPNLTAIPASTFYCSVDLRAVGTLGGGTGSFNILSTSSPLTSSDGSAYCILRVFDDGSVQAFDGTAFQSVVAAGGIVAGTTYTAQIDHNIVAGTWSSRVYNRTTGALIGSITNVPVRPTSDPNAASMNFTVSAQDPNANWDVAVDNMILSLARITVPTAGELRITAAGFNGSGEFVIDFIGTDLTDYEVTKSLDLQAAFAPLGIPLVVTTDASGIGQATVPAAEATTPAAFFRMEEQ
jgi:hypothetical protein